MQVTKGSIVNGAFAILRISGLTSNPSPEDVSSAIQESDDLALEMKGSGLDVNWQQPQDYGLSDPSDISGLTPEMAGPFKSILALRLLDFFGKIPTPSLAKRASDGMRSLEQFIISVPDAELPSTLSLGSGNEWDYRSRYFYPEPGLNNDADYVFKNDILNYTEDFSSWLIDETLASVEWEVKAAGILIADDVFDDNTATAQLTFNKVGGYTVCITATKTNSTDKLTVQKNFIIRDCQRTGLSF